MAMEERIAKWMASSRKRSGAVEGATTKGTARIIEGMRGWRQLRVLRKDGVLWVRHILTRFPTQ